MSAAVDFSGDAFVIPKDRPMGRNFAGFGFLSALSRHSAAERLTALVRDDAAGQHFQTVVKSIQPNRATEVITSARLAGLKAVGCLYTSSVMNAQQAWLRELHGARSWSLCGVNHTLSSARIMDAITGLLTAPLQPWDALICTSRASKEVIERLFERQKSFLSERLGASRFVLPQLPVIPLGVDCDAQQRYMAGREAARAAHGIGPDDKVVLFLGRLSFHAKANPVPMYLALERAARRHSITLIECGWTANDAIAKAFAEARERLCPSVRSIVLDGRDAAARSQAWAAADVFCSLSDNIQETFGLTPIEAMASGLPVVVTDWDGYKDTVRDGIDGFTVPTTLAPAGAGGGATYRHALEIDTYDMFIAQVAATTAVDIDATAQAFDRLFSDPDLRQRLGANAAARAREVFDWRVIIRAYEALWAELAELRNASAPGPQDERGYWPARPDPFDLFSGFPTAVIGTRHRIRRARDVDEALAISRLNLRASMAHMVPEIPIPASLALWRRLGAYEVSVGAVLNAEASSPAMTVRALLLLAKHGLIDLVPPAGEA